MCLALKLGRVDAIYSQAPAYQFFIPKLGMERDVRFQDWAPEDEGTIHGIILSKRAFTEEEALVWQGMVREIQVDGTLLNIYKSYLSLDEAKGALIPLKHH